MGNTDSQIVAPVKSCSLKFPSRTEEVPSPHSWWRRAEGSVGYESRGGSGRCFLQPQTSRPYGSWDYQYLPDGGGGADSQLKPASPRGLLTRNRSQVNCQHAHRYGYLEGGAECDGVMACGRQMPERAPLCGTLDNRTSPKVLLGKDGTMRVEFTNARMVTMETQVLSGRPATAVPVPEPSLRTSKGSSLSSEGSWYDSPWGNATELPDSVFAGGPGADNSSGYTTYSSSARTEETAGGYASSGYNTFSSAQMEELSPGFPADLLFPPTDTNTCSSALTEDSGIGDSVISHAEHGDFSLAAPPGGALTESRCSPPLTPPAPPDAVGPEEEQRFSSLTLPGRRAEPVSGNSRKDFLKSRIQRLSDWTGSLSRKKRRVQESYSGGWDSGFCNSNTLWSSNPLHLQNQNPVQVLSGLSNGLQTTDALRQNIYENFMQDLEPGCSGAERAEAWEAEGEAEEAEAESSGGSLGSSEQLDLLFEKEQGAVRRAGWLSFKPLLSAHKDRKLEPVSRRKWRQYWITLKGCTLLFYDTYGKNGGDQELSPCYALLAEDSIVQAVPEHPKKENVFCLSNSYGDVFLFQAANQTDLENWVTAIHSACASLLARRQGREDTVRLLQSETRSLLQKIDMDGKMRKMAELQLSVITDPKNRKAVEGQIQQWEQNLEKLNVDLFRVRCYLSSLQGGELPNPKSLLAVASRPSKAALGRLGVFSVSSFHAQVCARDEATLRRRRRRSLSRGSRNKRGHLFSLKTLDSQTKHSNNIHSATQVFQGQMIGSPVHQPGVISEGLDAFTKLQVSVSPDGRSRYSSPDAAVAVRTPDGGVIRVAVREDDVVSDLLAAVCRERHLDQNQFCVRVTRRVGQNTETGTAAPGHLLRELVYDELELSAVNVFTIQLCRSDEALDFGLRGGDEVLVLNGAGVSGLDLALMETLFSRPTLLLVLRREEPSPEEPGAIWPNASGPSPSAAPGQLPVWTPDPLLTRDVPESLLPPVSDRATTHTHTESSIDDSAAEQNMERVYTLYQTFPESCSVEVDVPKNPYVGEASVPRPSPRNMSVSQRLCKVIQELVDTEKSYVKDLISLFDIYLTPLQRETFLSKEEMESLFGSLPEMLNFQRVFLHTLEERIASCPNLSSLETPQQFKKLLFSLGGSFLYYADHFKLYSGFCANHIKVQKVLERAKTDRAFKEFLDARNPTKQHSSTLESYLIKPIQRVLKYPLLLRELVSLTDPESEEHGHLTDALRAMEKVASHINEMQKIYEDYGTVFDQLAAEQSGPDKETTEISMGEFLVHSSVVWLNPLPSLGRLRKDPELTLFVFKRAVILVYRENSKLKRRMTGVRSADLDPFRFRWLIPVSAVQVRLSDITGTENPCVWELVHSKSQVEGRPETVFQLCSSDLETQANVVRVLRSIIRDGSKRALPPDRGAASSLRRTKPSDRGGTWRSRQRERRLEVQRTAPQWASEGRRHRCFLGDASSEPLLSGVEGAALEETSGLNSLTNELEAQLQRLHFTEESLQAGRSRLLEQDQDQEYSHAAGEPPLGHRKRMGPQGGALEEEQSLDLNSFLERDFSVQSMTSAISEDCFFEPGLALQSAAIPTV
ncbi:rho guanine nucleotide exchange factor TIAM2 isoform X2 [Lampris incognitus]|uniref:rho guanine nucleotide exchange factor TIAM2 isoform X2 n=1 Tax=Lampris incognitus TaxID=2546036 RepID=UPI0024B48612|nr:rho guanine nucleotide exchange factor TIAM2 isoform X2 [Lampris incognitus]